MYILMDPIWGFFSEVSFPISINRHTSQVMEVIGPRSVRNCWFISPMGCKQPTYVVNIHVLFSDNDWGVLNHLRPAAYLVSTIILRRWLDPEGLTWLGTPREIMGRTVYLYTNVSWLVVEPPIWKIWSPHWNISPGELGETEKYLKPPTNK